MSGIPGASLFRYWKENTDADGDALFWPGGPAGLPFRGSPRTLSQDEYENLSVAYKARVQTFDLKSEADLEEYRVILEKNANGYYQIRDRQPIKDKDTGEIMRIYLEWLEPAYELPQTKADKLPAEGQTYAVTGPDAPKRADEITGVNPDVAYLGKLAGVPPGLQFEQSRGRWF